MAQTLSPGATTRASNTNQYHQVAAASNHVERAVTMLLNSQKLDSHQSQYPPSHSRKNHSVNLQGRLNKRRREAKAETATGDLNNFQNNDTQISDAVA